MQSRQTAVWIIGHFRVHLSLHFKARLSAKSLLWKSVFIHIEIRTNYHNQNFALRLALKGRPRGTRKWPIAFSVEDFMALMHGTLKTRTANTSCEGFFDSVCNVMLETLMKFASWSLKQIYSQFFLLQLTQLCCLFVHFSCLKDSNSW